MELSLLKTFVPNDLKLWVADTVMPLKVITDNEILIDKAIIIFSSIPLVMKRLERSPTSIVNENFTLLDYTRIYFIHFLLIQNPSINITQIFNLADDEEKSSLVKALILLDHRGIAVEKVIDLARTNSVELFMALAINNPYPSKYFPQGSFNQLVLKALFSGLDIHNIVGLIERRNDELTRMVLDYKEERIQANRKVPESLPWALLQQNKI
ncbi:EboA domain-containing protein [Colwelliaceae bacterium 6471]